MDSTPPRLCNYALPSQRPEPLGMATPPLRPPGSVPFLWEEAPGKPRKSDDSGSEKDSKPRSASSLEDEDSKAARTISPDTTLDGPYYHAVGRSWPVFDGPPPVMGRSMSGCFVLEDRSFCSGSGRKKEKANWFWKRAGRRDILTRKPPFRPSSTSSCSSASSSSSMTSAHGGTNYCYLGDDYFHKGTRELVVDGGDENDGDGGKTNNNRIHITSFRRSRSLFSHISGSTTHLWASIYGGLKLVVPRRAKKVNKSCDVIV